MSSPIHLHKLANIWFIKFILFQDSDILWHQFLWFTVDQMVRDAIKKTSEEKKTKKSAAVPTILKLFNNIKMSSTE